MGPRNERNIEALMRAIADSAERMDYISVFPDHFKEPHGTDIERLAEHLAHRGVLVPSALTPAQLYAMAEALERELAGSGIGDPEAYQASVKAMERIARGEGSGQ